MSTLPVFMCQNIFVIFPSHNTGVDLPLYCGVLICSSLRHRCGIRCVDETDITCFHLQSMLQRHHAYLDLKASSIMHSNKVWKKYIKSQHFFQRGIDWIQITLMWSRSIHDVPPQNYFIFVYEFTDVKLIRCIHVNLPRAPSVTNDTSVKCEVNKVNKNQWPQVYQWFS